MKPTVPTPSGLDFGSRRLRLSDPVSIAGSQWALDVAMAVSGEPPWPTLQCVKGDSRPSLVVFSPDAPGDQFEMIPSDLPDSSYSLATKDDHIVITCSQPSGLVAALRTIGQNRNQDGTLGELTGEDTPAFRYRGIHLDVCRHFFGVSFLKRLIRLEAALGFNVFHWHLTEDQGWRVPIEKYPKLTEIGAFRTEKDGSTYGGFYTKDEIRDVVNYAGHFGIVVIPEIEVPGHSSAAIASYPELSCRGDQIPVANRWGIFDDVLCAGSDQVCAFIGDVFDEVVELFPSSLIHIGGDECPRTRWKECPRCGERIVGEGLADYDELQSYFIGRATRMLEERGRVAIGWDEILEGGLPEGTVVMSWRGTAGGIQAASAGHPVIMTPQTHCYFDYRQVSGDDAPGVTYADKDGRKAVTSVDKVLAFDPLEGLPHDAAKNVLGGQANVWTELMADEESVERMIAPRILSLSEALWSAPDERDWKAFKAKAQAGLGLLDAMGWRYTDVPELA